MAIQELDEFLVDLGAALEHGVGLSLKERLGVRSDRGCINLIHLESTRDNRYSRAG